MSPSCASGTQLHRPVHDSVQDNKCKGVTVTHAASYLPCEPISLIRDAYIRLAIHVKVQPDDDWWGFQTKRIELHLHRQEFGYRLNSAHCSPIFRRGIEGALSTHHLPQHAIPR